MNRVFHHYREWEDNNLGMYETVCFMDSSLLQKECAYTLKCIEQLQECMMFVIYHWKFAAEQNLTNAGRNRQAWLGQAACCFLHGAPEYITKLAWNTLSQKQMDAANHTADEVIRHFEHQYEKEAMPWQN